MFFILLRSPPIGEATEKRVRKGLVKQQEAVTIPRPPCVGSGVGVGGGIKEFRRRWLDGEGAWQEL